MIPFGFTLLACVEPYHRHIVISAPDKNGGMVVMVNVTTRSDANWEPDCILTPADWDELTRESVIAFAGAKGPARCSELLLQQVDLGVFEVIAPPPLGTLQKIVRCALTSENLSELRRKWVVTQIP